MVGMRLTGATVIELFFLFAHHLVPDFVSNTADYTVPVWQS